jgi:hypothetical protein
MALETVIGLSVLAITAIAYAFSRISKKRVKFVDQKVKVRGETEYVFVLYI